MRRRRGFTLAEVLVVIGMIVMLIAILFPALNGAREQARRTVCLSNIHQITAALFAYAEAHDRRFLSCDALSGPLGAPGQEPDPAVISDLLPFVPHPGVFHCPSDPRIGKRSFAINDYLGGSWQLIGHANYAHQVINSAQTFAVIEEADPRGSDSGKTGGFVVSEYPETHWVDIPAMFHGGRGTCLSFADGHCEFWPWQDPRTWGLIQQRLGDGTHPPQLYPDTPNNPDLLRLQAVIGSGKLPPQ